MQFKQDKEVKMNKDTYIFTKKHEGKKEIFSEKYLLFGRIKYGY